jgi:hypothetical protein
VDKCISWARTSRSRVPKLCSIAVGNPRRTNGSVGSFEFSDLQEGRYVVTLQLDGYGVGGVLGGVTAPGEIDYLVVPETAQEM